MRGTSGHSSGSGVPDMIDEKACSPSNQHVSGRYGDTEMNEIGSNVGPLRHTPRPGIGEDQKRLLKEDHIDHGSLYEVDQPQFHHEALPSPYSTQSQVALPGQPAMYSHHTMGSLTIPATTEFSIGEIMAEVPYLEGPSWLYGDRSEHFCQQTPHNIIGTL